MSIPCDIEMSFLRTLSVHGFMFSGDLSPQDRRERIRVAIIQQRLSIERFSDRLTFAQAFRECYAQPLDMRRVPRDSRHRPTNFPIPIPDDEADCGDKDEEGFC